MFPANSAISALKVRRGCESPATVNHCSWRRHEIWCSDVVTFFFLHDDAADEFGQLFVARTALHLRVKIMIPYGEKAGANLAVAGDTDAAAVSAEGMRDGRDDPDFADAVFEAIAAGGL